MAQGNKVNLWVWIALIIVVIIALFMWWKNGAPTTGGLGAIIEETIGGDSAGTSAPVGPKVQICINNGGTWNKKENKCDLPDGDAAEDDANKPTQENDEQPTETETGDDSQPGMDAAQEGDIAAPEGDDDPQPQNPDEIAQPEPEDDDPTPPTLQLDLQAQPTNPDPQPQPQMDLSN